MSAHSLAGTQLPRGCVQRPRARVPSRAGQPLRPCAVAAPERPSTSTWSPESWRSKKALQMPEYPDAKQLEAAVTELKRCPPLIFAGEVRAWTSCTSCSCRRQ